VIAVTANVHGDFAGPLERRVMKRFWTNAAQMTMAVCLGLLLSPVATSVGWEWRHWVLH
jgi:hypothetical protein